MIDALLNVALFAVLVLCITGFGVDRASLTAHEPPSFTVDANPGLYVNLTLFDRYLVRDATRLGLL
jgi:hypothetical protein